MKICVNPYLEAMKTFKMNRKTIKLSCKILDQNYKTLFISIQTKKSLTLMIQAIVSSFDQLNFLNRHC